MVDTNNRVFLDTVTLANTEDVIGHLNRLSTEGYTLVIPNTVLDVKVFQENPDWLKKHLADESIVIQMWLTPDQMTAKAFYWSSCGMTTEPAACFEDAIENLPNWEGIMELCELMNQYGLSREQWNPGAWAPPEPLNPEYQELLGVPDGATRTDVLAACKLTGHMEVFDEYNLGYNRGLATQHHCGLIMGTDGNVKAL